MKSGCLKEITGRKFDFEAFEKKQKENDAKLRGKTYLFVDVSDIGVYVYNVHKKGRWVNDECPLRDKKVRKELFEAASRVFKKHGYIVNPWCDVKWGSM